MKKDTSNYRPLLRYSSQIRGVFYDKRLGVVAWTITPANFGVAFLSLFVSIPLAFLFWRFNAVLAIVIAGVIPVFVYRLYDTLEGDGLKIPSFLWSQLHYLITDYFGQRTLYQDEKVHYTHDEVTVSGITLLDQD